MNFIDVEDLEESVENLSEVESISELYLTGNPVDKWTDYKDYIIAKVPQLKRLDGEDITRSMRIAAKQRLKQLEQDLKVAAEESLAKK